MAIRGLGKLEQECFNVDLGWRTLHSPQATSIDRTIGGADNLWMTGKILRAAAPFPSG